MESSLQHVLHGLGQNPKSIFEMESYRDIVDFCMKKTGTLFLNDEYSKKKDPVERTDMWK